MKSRIRRVGGWDGIWIGHGHHIRHLIVLTSSFNPIAEGSVILVCGVCAYRGERREDILCQSDRDRYSDSLAIDQVRHQSQLIISSDNHVI
jgi:hypothetical protein